MTIQRDVELRLRAHFEEHADRSVPDGQVAGILAITAGRRQRPGWLAALRSPSMTDLTLTRPAVPRALPLVVVLALIAAGLIAALLLGVGRPKPPPINGQIVIGRMDPGRDDAVLYTLNPDGTHLVNLWPGTTEGGFWSPDGSEVGFGLAIIKADGTGYHEFNANRYPFHVHCWDWSPDGKRLLCEGFSDTQDPQIHGVYSIRATDGGDLVRLDAPGDQGVPGSYSPDGSLVAYVGTFDGDAGALIVVRADGSGRHRIGLFGNAGDPRWSPDGKTILISAGGNLMAVDVATGRLTDIRVKGVPRRDVIGGMLSPDGTRVLVKRDVAGQVDLFTMRLDGTDLVRVTNDTIEERFFDWGTHPLAQ